MYWIHQPLSGRTDTKERFHRTVQVRDIIDRVWYIQKLSFVVIDGDPGRHFSPDPVPRIYCGGVVKTPSFRVFYYPLIHIRYQALQIYRFQSARRLQKRCGSPKKFNYVRSLDAMRYRKD